MPKNLTATLSDLSVHDATLYAFATFSDGHTCRVRYAPPSTGAPGNGAELYRRAGKWRDGDTKWDLIEFGNANDARLAAVVEAASAIYGETIERDRLDRLEVAADNEARDEARNAVYFAKDAGPLLLAVLERIAGTADISELLDDEPDLARDLEVALAAAKGETVDGKPLPVWQYRAIGDSYFSGCCLRAPDEATARLLATTQLREGKDKFYASRAYLPEEVEVRVAP